MQRRKTNNHTTWIYTYMYNLYTHYPQLCIQVRRDPTSVIVGAPKLKNLKTTTHGTPTAGAPKLGLWREHPHSAAVMKYLWETLTVKLCCLEGLAILVSKALVFLSRIGSVWWVVIYHTWCFVLRWCCGGGVLSILAFRREALPTLRYFPRIPNWPWVWPCWNCTGSYKFSVSVKKMGEGWTGGASDIVKAMSSGEDPRATEGLVSNLPDPQVNKTKQQHCYFTHNNPHFRALLQSNIWITRKISKSWDRDIQRNLLYNKWFSRCFRLVRFHR